MVIVAIPMLLIYLQPDLGTSLTLIAVWMAMIWMAGIRFRHLFLFVAASVAALPLIWLNLEDYMRDRILLFVNPTGDPDSYFNVYQSLVSIGSGGWTGKGLTHGTQSQLHFLRVRHTDFIFAVTAEELGLFGAVAMIGLVFVVLWRMIRVAEQAQDTYGRLLASGIAAVILFQSIVNIGMNLGIMPVTGIPLPFVSYGGSSLSGLDAGHRHRRKRRHAPPQTGIRLISLRKGSQVPETELDQLRDKILTVLQSNYSSLCRGRDDHPL